MPVGFMLRQGLRPGFVSFIVGKHITSQAFAFLFTVTLVIVTLALLLNEVTMTAVPLHADGAK